MVWRIGDPRAEAALLAPKASRKLWYLRGRRRTPSVWLSVGCISKLINTIYKRGGAVEAELGACGDTGYGEVLQATRWGRFAWRRKAQSRQALHLRPEKRKRVPSLQSRQTARTRERGQSRRQGALNGPGHFQD